MSSLGDMLSGADDAAASEVSGARLDDLRRQAVRSKVRRTHARRVAVRSSIAAVAVVVAGIGGVYVFNDGAVAPAADSGGSVANEPSETPSPSPVPVVTDWPGFTGEVTEDPHLPTASALTPEVWTQVQPGWSLVSYRERWGEGSREGSGPQVVYLASPTGELFEVTRVDGDTVGVMAWQTGATTAAVSVQPEGEAPYMGVLDLLTGEVTRKGDYAPFIWSFAFLAADGTPVWRGSDGTDTYMTIAPDGTALGYVMPAYKGAAEIAARETGLEDCDPAAAFDDESVLVQCRDAEGAAAVVRVWTQAGRAELLTDFDARQPTRVADAVVAATGSVGLEDCPTHYTVISGQEPEGVPGWDDFAHPLPEVFPPFGAAGSLFIYGATSGCTGDLTPLVVFASDFATGEGAVLVPFPEARPEGEEPFETVTGVAVGR